MLSLVTSGALEHRVRIEDGVAWCDTCGWHSGRTRDAGSEAWHRACLDVEAHLSAVAGQPRQLQTWACECCSSETASPGARAVTLATWVWEMHGGGKAALFTCGAHDTGQLDDWLGSRRRPPLLAADPAHPGPPLPAP
jgi:hypothetical protein